MTRSTPTNAGHTPGPWVADWLDNENGWVLAGRDYLAEIVTSDEEGRVRPDHEREANARLIAAAPDMLAACKAVLSDAEAFRVHIGPEHAERLRAAIARAEGRGA